ncbi:MAG TPA: cupin, partial [Dehalococcoidia bacterium]|nr:cupin [Dehalococcoidia bacterium]
MQPSHGAPKTTYEMWIEREGIPIIEGYGVEDVVEVPRGPWARLGGLGAFIQLRGMEGVTGMYVAEIPSGGALNPQKHLYE